MSKLSQTKIAIQVASATITKLKMDLIDAIKDAIKKNKHEWFILTSEVTIEMVGDSTLEITSISKKGNIETISSSGRKSRESSLDELNVSQLFDLLIQIDENDIIYIQEVG